MQNKRSFPVCSGLVLENCIYKSWTSLGLAQLQQVADHLHQIWKKHCGKFCDNAQNCQWMLYLSRVNHIKKLVLVIIPGPPDGGGGRCRSSWPALPAASPLAGCRAGRRCSCPECRPRSWSGTRNYQPRCRPALVGARRPQRWGHRPKQPRKEWTGLFSA